MQKVSISLSEDAVARINAAAATAGLSRAEWIRQACSRAITGETPESQGGSLIRPAERTRMEEAIRTVEETLATVTAERDAFAARVMELEALTRTAAAEVAAALAERDRLAEAQDRVEDERTRAKTRATAAAAERDQAWRDLAEALARATTAETRAAVLEGVSAERDQRIADLHRALATLEGQLETLIAIVNRAIPGTAGTAPP